MTAKEQNCTAFCNFCLSTQGVVTSLLDDFLVGILSRILPFATIQVKVCVLERGSNPEGDFHLFSILLFAPVPVVDVLFFPSSQYYEEEFGSSVTFECNCDESKSYDIGIVDNYSLLENRLLRMLKIDCWEHPNNKRVPGSVLDEIETSFLVSGQLNDSAIYQMKIERNGGAWGKELLIMDSNWYDMDMNHEESS